MFGAQSASAWSLPQVCSGAAAANVCLSGYTDDPYVQTHVGIDVWMSAQDAQAILAQPGNCVLGRALRRRRWKHAVPPGTPPLLGGGWSGELLGRVRHGGPAVPAQRRLRRMVAMRSGRGLRPGDALRRTYRLDPHLREPALERPASEARRAPRCSTTRRCSGQRAHRGPRPPRPRPDPGDRRAGAPGSAPGARAPIARR